MGIKHVERINDLIYHALKHSMQHKDCSMRNDIMDTGVESNSGVTSDTETEEEKLSVECDSLITNFGKLLIDATACPQDFAYPTNLKLLHTSSEKSEEILYKLYDSSLHSFKKPKTYNEVARERYLHVSKKKCADFQRFERL
jgi:IS5 family transposase